MKTLRQKQYKIKRKVLKKSNRLIRFLYNFNMNVSVNNVLSTDDKFALLDYDTKFRKLTEVLINKFGNYDS